MASFRVALTRPTAIALGLSFVAVAACRRPPTVSPAAGPPARSEMHVGGAAVPPALAATLPRPDGWVAGHADAGAVVGIVVAAETGRPLYGARPQWRPAAVAGDSAWHAADFGAANFRGDTPGLSGPGGQFGFTRVPAGTPLAIRVGYVGRYPVERAVTVAAGRAETLFVVLRSGPPIRVQ